MKQFEFIQLAKDVANCRICEHLTTLPHAKNTEYLENDDHGLNTDHPYINRWNLWHGNLDADIMVIGQDYGVKENGDPFIVCDYKNTTNRTDIQLKELFLEAFEIDIDSPDTSLFFTNMANCYRKQRTSGGKHSAWLPICANKFMSRLIRIIRPKIIIVLGKSSFEALHCMEDLSVKCIDQSEKGKGDFSEIIEHNYKIDIDGLTIDVFPVYHPGSNSQINRSKEHQLEDWKRIAIHYNKIR